MKKLTYLLLFLSHFCFAQETINGSIMHDALERTFILYVPEIYDEAVAVPLVFNFHGYTSDAEEQMNYGDFRTIADTAGFILVHPMGTLDEDGQPYWNADWGGAADDIGFTEALIDSLSMDYNINPERIYSTGMSNGGFMSYTLACYLSDRFAAVASVTGTMVNGQPANCDIDAPLPILEIHGTADFIVPYNGNGSWMLPVEDVLDFWIGINDCSAEPIVTDLPDTDPNDGSTVTHMIWPDGTWGADIEHYKVNGGGHTWPGAESPFGFTNQDINASEIIWQFFAKYDKGGLISDVVTPTINNINIFPNPASSSVTITSDKPQSEKLVITDVTGKNIFEKNWNTKLQIDLSDVQAGVYFLYRYGNDESFISTDKIIVTK